MTTVRVYLAHRRDPLVITDHGERRVSAGVWWPAACRRTVIDGTPCYVQMDEPNDKTPDVIPITFNARAYAAALLGEVRAERRVAP